MNASIVQTALTSLKLLDSHTELPYEITPTSFSVCNEKLLLTILIDLLSLHSESFRTDIASSYNWPYHDTKEKNECKKMILKELQNLVKIGKLSSTYVKSSILTVAKGPSVWQLLWKLSDAILSKLILGMEIDDSNVKSGSGSDVNVAVKPDLEECLVNIGTETRRITHETSIALHKQHKLQEYSGQLNGRWKCATQSIEIVEKRLTDLETRRGDILLEDRFETECQQIMTRIETFAALLEYLSTKNKANKKDEHGSHWEENIVPAREMEDILNRCLSASADDGQGDSNQTLPNSVENSLNVLASKVSKSIDAAKSTLATGSSVNVADLRNTDAMEDAQLTKISLALKDATSRSALVMDALASLRNDIRHASTQNGVSPRAPDKLSLI
jgi:hypothetical protein